MTYTDTVKQALIQHGSIELAADELSTNNGNKTLSAGKLEKEDISVYDALKKLKTKMKSPVSAERLKVDDEDDIAIDLTFFNILQI